MNLGLTTSFIIAGMLMLIIAGFNLRLNRHATDLTLHEMSKSHTESVYEMILYDFKKIGYDTYQIGETPVDPIQSIGDHSITFKAKFDQDPSTDPSTITWELTTDIPAGSDNPDHRTLERRIAGGDTTSIGIGITRFDLRYFNRDGNETTDPSAIRSIEVIIETQPREGVSMPGGQTRYPVSQWRKTIVPGNLSMNTE
ncbi:MAG: hypothetical protein WD035_01705 [Balneolaceae bacterium]